MSERMAIIRIEVPLAIEVEECVSEDAKHDREWAEMKRGEILDKVIDTLRLRLPHKYVDVQQQFVQMPAPTVHWIED